MSIILNTLQRRLQMKFWMQIMIFITLGLTTMSSQSVVDADTMDRIGGHRVSIIKNNDQILVFGNFMTIYTFSSEKLSKAIVDRVDDVSRLYELSVHDASRLSYDIDFNVHFTVFSSKMGKTYRDIQCKAILRHSILNLLDCGNDQVKFGEEHIEIPVSEIRYEPSTKREETEETRETLN